ncbi:MAG: hypothetical protein A3F70_13985 [Acidobacteria bacterium RIFCSPLOWO2_12_FULL_67_14]|nr:MAG: hypothetical protein A3F70_13985 [Acidobacteria bacterium RIFCSPLOWO2_12_FULL_67_14]
MKSRFVRTLAGTAAFVLVASVASAQAPSTAVLNVLEVRQLVARAEPADHARLERHFSALAFEHGREASRHAAMATAIGGNPNHPAPTASAHCARLAEINTQSAVTLRELARHHAALAGGMPSTTPDNAGRFENGEGAPAPTDDELRVMAARAKTPSDHRALQEYFVTLALRYEAEAADHGTMAGAYRGNANRRGGDPAVHCDRLVKLLREAADEARAAAARHDD